MAKRKIFIWHTETGEIVAHGYVPDNTPVPIGVVPLAEPGRSVVEVEVEEEMIARLDETHLVDTDQRVLVPRRADY